MSTLGQLLYYYLYLIKVFLLYPLSRKGPNARHTKSSLILFFANESLLFYIRSPNGSRVPKELKKSGDPWVAAQYLWLDQLLNQNLLSLNNSVSVNCNYDVDTLLRCRNCSTGRCEVSLRNNLCTLNNEVLDRCCVEVYLSQVPL